MADIVHRSRQFSGTSGGSADGWTDINIRVMSDSVDPKPVKHSVAVFVVRGDKILTVKRPESDDELPGIWGLPAGTCSPGETPQDVVRRIGREKLRARLEPTRVLATGTQDRPAYLLEMDLFEARMDGVPQQGEWKWAPRSVLRNGQSQGSLCCHLALSMT